MKDIAIFGAGGFGREVAMLIDQINAVSPTWNLVGYFDDRVAKGEVLNGHRVLGTMADLNNYNSELGIVFALGDSSTKKMVLSKISNTRVFYPSLIHPQSIVPTDYGNTIGEGCIICAGCIVTVNTAIGDHVILNLGCTLGHDSIIGDFSSFMPSVNISGEVKIGSGVFVGTGTKIINLVTIGENTIIGAGAVVSKDIPANCTAVGVPAKPIKFHG